MTDDCLFCRIVSGELETSFIAENAHAVAFLDLSPRSPGHTLVIPRAHAAILPELQESEVGPLFSLVRSVATELGEKLGAPGMTIGINQGDVAGQAVRHLHVHVMPRFAGDGGRSIHDIVHHPSTPAQQEIISTLTP